MRGDQVLWVPGSDHAGIATQVCLLPFFYLFLGEKDISQKGFLSFSLSVFTFFFFFFKG